MSTLIIARETSLRRAPGAASASSSRSCVRRPAAWLYGEASLLLGPADDVDREVEIVRVRPAAASRACQRPVSLCPVGGGTGSRRETVGLATSAPTNFHHVSGRDPRERLGAERKALIHQLRPLVLERGIVPSQRRDAVAAWIEAPRDVNAPAPVSHPGRDAGYPAPPGQIRACAANALGSHLGYLTRKRCCGQGCRILADGIQRAAIGFIRRHGT
jgi:hypothetical protein